MANKVVFYLNIDDKNIEFTLAKEALDDIKEVIDYDLYADGKRLEEIRMLLLPTYNYK